jgi:hypothetical protein
MLISPKKFSLFPRCRSMLVWGDTMKSISAVIIASAAACALVSCAGNQGPCNRYRTETSINQSRVPGPLRDLIPLVLKWGTGDTALRDRMEQSITADEWKQFRDSLHGRTAEIEQWLDTARRTGNWSAEGCAFRFLLEFYNDMNDLQLIRTLKK